MILELIKNNNLKPGDVIPSENELSHSYNISRMTVKKAIDNLAIKGIVERKRGVGTFLKKSEERIELPLNRLKGFSKDVESIGKIPVSKLLNFRIIEATKEISKNLDLKIKEKVYYIERVRIIDDIPAVFEESYIPVSLLPELTEKILLKSKFSYVNEVGYKLGRSEREISGEIPSTYIANILNLKQNEPVLFARCHTYLSNGLILEYSNIYYNQKKYRFKLVAEND